MTDEAPRSTRFSSPEAGSSLGNFLGTGIRGGMEWFVRRYGPAAAATACAKLTPASRKLVDPHDAAIGILGARKYPYAFVGELMRAMAAAVRADEDKFLAEIAAAGVDATLNTVARVVLKYIVSPQILASRAQEMWNVFHDAGRVTIVEQTENEYVAQLSDWPNHDLTVCKLCMEARRHVVSKTGLEVDVRREKCQAWGHPICQARVRWK